MSEWAKWSGLWWRCNRHPSKKRLVLLRAIVFAAVMIRFNLGRTFCAVAGLGGGAGGGEKYLASFCSAIVFRGLDVCALFSRCISTQGAAKVYFRWIFTSSPNAQSEASIKCWEMYGGYICFNKGFGWVAGVAKTKKSLLLLLFVLSLTLFFRAQFDTIIFHAINTHCYAGHWKPERSTCGQQADMHLRFFLDK